MRKHDQSNKKPKIKSNTRGHMTCQQKDNENDNDKDKDTEKDYCKDNNKDISRGEFNKRPNLFTF